MIRIAIGTLILVLLVPTLCAGQRTGDEKEIWSMEEAYWRYVQANDLSRYRSLWHADFLGWPSVSPEPLRKDHITNWITDHTSKGENLKSYNLERLAVQVTNDVATTAYRIRLMWTDRNGAGQSGTFRVIHTLRRNADGRWQIISGMSAPTDAQGH